MNHWFKLAVAALWVPSMSSASAWEMYQLCVDRTRPAVLGGLALGLDLPDQIYVETSLELIE